MSGYRYAFTLSKEEVRSSEPPGTKVLLGIIHGWIHVISRLTLSTDNVNQDVGSTEDDTSRHLKLIPRPTNDPLDPLNFPNVRKMLIWLVMCLYALAADFIPASVAPALTIMKYTKFQQQTFGELSYLVSVSSGVTILITFY
jgi:hypothetical protein